MRVRENKWNKTMKLGLKKYKNYLSPKQQVLTKITNKNYQILKIKFRINNNLKRRSKILK